MTITPVPSRPRALSATSGTVPLAEVCHVCHRGLVGRSDGAAWTVACTRCRRIDGRLGQQHGVTQCTPLWGGSPGVPRPNLLQTLMRGPSFEQALEVLRWRHTRQTVAMASSLAIPDLLEVPGGDVEGARIVDWAAWSAAYPATDEAIATAYGHYVADVHPWIDSVEPRVGDRSWLAGLLTT